MNIGDVVRLKSGGPPMTVEAVKNQSGVTETSTDEIRCVWFDASAMQVVRSLFKRATLAPLKDFDFQQHLVAQLVSQQRRGPVRVPPPPAPEPSPIQGLDVVPAPPGGEQKS